MNNRYADDDGLRWELIRDILGDVTDGYLANTVDTNRLEDRLQNILDKIKAIADVHCVLEESEKDTMYRLTKFTPLVSDLSDQYAAEDSTYREQWHDDILASAKRSTTGSGRLPTTLERTVIEND